jgi:cobalt-zinc-cadmium efflux system protein
VVEVHDFHVWTVCPGWVSLSAHPVKTSTADPASILADMRTRLFDRFGIEHVTIKIEESDTRDCSTGTCGDVKPGSNPLKG